MRSISRNSLRKEHSERKVPDDLTALTDVVNLVPLIFGKPREIRFCPSLGCMSFASPTVIMVGGDPKSAVDATQQA